MRILHTSDWHLGRSFHGRDLLVEQDQVLTHLAALVTAEGVDVVVVAGDIFDRALPSAAAVSLYDRALWRLRQAGAQIVLISGNHDSAARLGATARFQASGGLHVHTAVEGCTEPTVLADVAFYGLPFLEPETSRGVLGAPPGCGHQGVLAAAMDAVRADLATRPPGTRSVVLAHAFVVAGSEGGEKAASTCDSERSLSVGGVQTATSDLFDGVDYVALGHLHGCQQPDPTRPWLRYSGSPLAYSFSEVSQRKSVLLVDLDPTGLADVRRVELPAPRRLTMLTGTLAELLDDNAHRDCLDDYVSAVLTDVVRPMDAMRRLQARFQQAVAMEWRPAGVDPTRGIAARPRPERDDLATATEFLECVRSGPTERERRLLDAAFGAARIEAAVG